MSEDNLQLDGPSAPYLEMLAEAERIDKTYHDICDTVDRRYSDLECLSEEAGDREFQIFYANIEVLRPTIYTRPPVPVVSSRFNDRKDLPRRAADILERALISDIEADDLHDTMVLCRDDLILTARGVPWVKMRMRDGVEVPSAYHIDRKDYRHGPARKWSEVPWVACRTWNTRREVEARFKGAGPKALDRVSYDQQTIGGKNEGTKKAQIWELWHKANKTVCWVTPGVEELLDEQKPWMDVTGFFPTPRPAYGVLKRSTLTPVPDMLYYRDQLAEINELTCRMSKLCESLKMRGFYPAGNADVAEAIESAMKQLDDRAILVPVSSLAALGPNTSLKDSIIWLPVKEVAEVVQYLVEMRRQLIEDVYEITGLSDIMRGSTEAQETATAQRLKSQYGSVRVRERQTEMQRLARDVIRIKAEAMAEHMKIEDVLAMAQVDDLPTEESLQPQMQQIVQQAQQAMMQLHQAEMSGQMPPEQAMQQGQQLQQQAQQALDQLKQTVTVEKVGQLLKDQRIRPFVLEIETDSTIEPDQQAEKEQRVEFAAAMGPMLQQSMEAMQLAPMLGSFFAESVRYMASGFKVDRRMDEAIDQLSEAMKNYQPPPQQPKEDPAIAQAQAQTEMVKAEAAKAKGESDTLIAQLKLQSEQMKAQGAQGDVEKTAAETEKLRAEVMKIMQEIQMAPQELAIEQQGQQIDAQQGVMKMRMDAQSQQQDNARQDKQMAFDQKRAVGEDKRADKQLAVSSKTEAAKAKALSRPPANGV